MSLAIVAVLAVAALWAVWPRPHVAHPAAEASHAEQHAPTGAASASAAAQVPGAEHPAHANAPVSPSTGEPAEPTSLYETTRDDLLGVLAERGPRAALAALDRLIRTQPAVSGLCHAVAHDLGHAALARYDGDASRALRDRDDVCGGGYTHGVVEMALGSSKNPARDLLRVCAPRQDGSCFHGVGHGLMFATGMRPGASLRLCDRSPDSTLAHRCAEGVFMQLFSGDAAAGHMAADSSMTSDEARAQCQSTRSTYQANCWFYSPNIWLAESPDDFTGALAWCAGAGSSLGRTSCARGAGSRTVKYHPDDLSIGERACAASGPLARDCVGGMASYWSVHWKGERPASDLCHRLQSRRMRSLCQDAA